LRTPEIRPQQNGIVTASKSRIHSRREPCTKAALFGFNGLDIGREMPPPLSTVRSNGFLFGKTATELAIQSVVRPQDTVIMDAGFEIFSGATARKLVSGHGASAR
jgi:DNA-binding LacI/PurR family transcriptional regulator